MTRRYWGYFLFGIGIAWHVEFAKLGWWVAGLTGATIAVGAFLLSTTERKTP
jgi:hypothetical protein